MRYEITAPARGFNGTVAEVEFHQGQAAVDTEADGADAALGYFRRKGYTVVAVDKPEQTETEQGSGPADEFDPGEHSVDDVLAYLESVDEAETERVLAAEQAGKARKTILQKGADQ